MKMKNAWRIEGDTLIVYNRKDGREILFDAEDFDWLSGHTWYIHALGYAQAQISGRPQKAHRIIRHNPKGQVDHIDGNRVNNRRANLRVVSNRENQHNQRGAKGYYLETRSGRWKAQIMNHKQVITLGRYETEQEARQAYLNAKRIYHPSTPADYFTGAN